MHLVYDLVKQIGQLNKLQIPFLKSSIEILRDDEYDALTRYLEFTVKQGKSMEYLANCYNTIVKDTLKEQYFFIKNKRYRYSKFSDVANHVYYNNDYMEMYMHGLAITGFLWPNHLYIHRWFSTILPRVQSGYYLEIGPGHGYYFMKALRLTKYDRFLGLDISPKSVELTKAILDSKLFGYFNNYRIIEQDFLAFSEDEYFDAVVMGEVLEHVEEPEAFLKKIHSLTYPNSFIYITTAINSPAIDHIYLFDSPESVQQLVYKCGFQIKNKLLVPYNELSLDEALNKKMPINIALSISPV